jgi:hypothetical protein
MGVERWEVMLGEESTVWLFEAVIVFAIPLEVFLENTIPREYWIQKGVQVNLDFTWDTAWRIICHLGCYRGSDENVLYLFGSFFIWIFWLFQV